ncbi:MAG: serpin family protein [Parachlamydiales bacterium]|nr:serpin family protein [Candidatus Acheromyda pituitae]
MFNPSRFFIRGSYKAALHGKIDDFDAGYKWQQSCHAPFDAVDPKRVGQGKWMKMASKRRFYRANEFCNRLINKTTAILLSLSVPCMGAEADSPSDNIAQMVSDHTRFATHFYQAATPSTPSNIVFSPYSISTCMTMVFLGARDTTADEIQTTLYLNLERDLIPSTTLALIQQLEGKSKDATGYQLKLANAVWVDQHTYILSDYSHTLESAFRAKIDRINFQQATKATETINRWISDQTSSKITDLLHPGDIDDNTRLVLTNAVYFQGSFTSPFDEKKTKQAPFYPTPDTSSTVRMMQQTGSFSYLENDLFQMAGLPFKSKNGSKISLVILLPRSTDNLPQIENDMSDSFPEWINAMKGDRLLLQIPKFTVKKRLDLNNILQMMGMKIPFTTQANFSGIDGKLDLYLSKVVHEALFALDEAGVVAAAATAASIGVTSVGPTPAPTPFVADHPFLYFIVDGASSEILFMGKFQEPKDVL